MRIGLAFRPNTFQIDFEIGMIVSIRESFGYETIIKGCLFHFSQSIWRKVQYLGLVHDYNHIDEIKKTIRRISSLALVPMDQIDNCWTEIHAQAPQHEGNILHRGIQKVCLVNFLTKYYYKLSQK